MRLHITADLHLQTIACLPYNFTAISILFSIAKIPKMDQEKRNQTENRSGKRKRDLTEEEKARRHEWELFF